MTTKDRTASLAITFTVVPSTMGLVLVAHEPPSRGLVSVLMGDDENSLVAELIERFPGAELLREDKAGTCAAIAQQVLRLVETPAIETELELNVRGTAFQQMVWQALREIPRGETVSYTELAERIGRPRSVRAVAAACAANQIAIAIPCHRVVRSNGDLSGYRWGVARKRALLESEGALPGRSRARATV